VIELAIDEMVIQFFVFPSMDIFSPLQFNSDFCAVFDLHLLRQFNSVLDPGGYVQLS